MSAVSAVRAVGAVRAEAQLELHKGTKADRCLPFTKKQRKTVNKTKKSVTIVYPRINHLLM
jgi:hypothetical protein